MELLLDQEKNLKEYAELTEEDILDIWFVSGQDLIQPKDIKIYNYNAPLYVKMIWRFRENEEDVLRFYFNVDDGAKQKLRENYGLDKRVMEFFRFVAFSLVPAKVPNLNVWKADKIQWFYELNEDSKRDLIKQSKI